MTNNLPKLIGLTGYARVGKDTVANILVNEYGYTKIAFADSIREMVYALDPLITNTECMEIRVSEALERFGYERTKDMFPEFRQLIQRMGTEAGRKILGDDIWRKTTFRKISTIQTPVVISDVRTTEEAKDTQYHGGIVVQITRPDIGLLNDHATEKGIDSTFVGFHMKLKSKNEMPLSDMPQQVVELFNRYTNTTTWKK